MSVLSSECECEGLDKINGLIGLVAMVSKGTGHDFPRTKVIFWMLFFSQSGPAHRISAGKRAEVPNAKKARVRFRVRRVAAAICNIRRSCLANDCSLCSCQLNNTTLCAHIDQVLLPRFSTQFMTSIPSTTLTNRLCSQSKWKEVDSLIDMA